MAQMPPDMSEMEAYYERTRRSVIPTPKTPLARLGCGIALVFWFLLLFLPCGLFLLAVNGDITLYHANVPEPDSHPLFQVRLIMDAENRGLQFVTSQIVTGDDARTCVQTQSRYFLWQQSDPGDLTAVFCDCYERAVPDADWTLTETQMRACTAEE